MRGHLDRAKLPIAQSGYVTFLDSVLKGKRGEVSRSWSMLLADRLHRTAVELREVTEGDGRLFTEVASPAVAAASNLLDVLGRGAVDADDLNEIIAQAEDDLDTASVDLDRLEAKLRGEGIPLD